MRIVDSLKDQDLIFKYLSTMLTEKEQIIQEEYSKIILAGGKVNNRFYDDFKDLMLRFVKTLCEKKYKSKLSEYVKKKYFPIEESLKVIYDVIN